MLTHREWQSIKAALNRGQPYLTIARKVGVSTRTVKRVAEGMHRWEHTKLPVLFTAVDRHECKECGGVTSWSPCPICQYDERPDIELPFARVDEYYCAACKKWVEVDPCVACLARAQRLKHLSVA